MAEPERVSLGQPEPGFRAEEGLDARWLQFAPSREARGTELRFPACVFTAGRPARFEEGAPEFARLGQKLLAEFVAGTSQVQTSKAESDLIHALAREVAELRLRIAALECPRDPAAEENQREHEEAIYAEMREAGFDPNAFGDDLDPKLPQEIWDEVLGEE